MTAEHPDGTVWLAPCGINCSVCYAHLRKKRTCLGCNGADAAKPDHCRVCKIKTCAEARGLQLCAECADFPCRSIKDIDKRYRTRYFTSLIENGRRAQAVGIPAFLAEDRPRWTCAACGGVISMHDRVCSVCGKAI